MNPNPEKYIEDFQVSALHVNNASRDPIRINKDNEKQIGA